MKTKYIKYFQNSLIQSLGALFILLLCIGCEDHLETESPVGQIPHQLIFEDEATATAAITSMYAKLRDDVLLPGNITGLSVQLGLYADELDYYGTPGGIIEPFYQHQILASNETINNVWNKSYNLIYMANAAIEGLETSQTLSEPIKNQLLGEALFIRAMTHFYLLNLFGDIPFITTTNFQINSQVSRLIESEVYELIITDLTQAKSLLNTEYVTGERTRANKWVASALLAKVFLYSEQWQSAEMESSLLINNTSLFNLPLNMDEVFLKTSPSAILQLKTKMEGAGPTEALTFVFASGPPPVIALNPSLIAEMENNDLRKEHWVGEINDGTSTWYYSNKYEQGNALQYSTTLRLAEQYLIRAEARARQNNLAGAQQDVNTIRQRAGLSNTAATTSEELLSAILEERRFEFFTEHGDRWFSLKRFGLAESLLSPIKPGWKSTNVLWPLPEAELLMNQNLLPQNPGY